jgi:hypothetical protein
MPIDPTALANLLARSAAGERIAVCEYLKVDWDGSTTSYYGAAAWHQIPPFTGIGFTIEPRLKASNLRDPFHSLEINPDIRTESVKVTFEDIDKDITGKFQTYSSGVACEFFLYYPQEDLTVSLWSGQLQAPDVFGWKTVTATATNGSRSRELTIGSRRRTRECTANVFGGKLPDTDSVRSSLCPYDKHLGGSTGNYKTGTTPYADCPKTETACTARLSNGGLYFGGFNTDASAMVTDGNSGYIASSRSNASSLKEQIPVIFGKKKVKGKVLLWRRELNQGNQAQGYMRAVCEVGEGPIQSISNIRVNGTFVGQEHIWYRLGHRGQPRGAYAPNMSNFTSLAHFQALLGPTDPREKTPEDFDAECLVEGFNDVCVYTDDSPITKTRTYSTNRIWCLLEVYRNQKFGYGYAESKIEIADWMTEAAFSEDSVSFTATFEDGETTTYVSPRSTFNAILEGRPVGEQIEDICRSGGIAIPFEHEGKFTVRSLRKATAGELSAARVFTDTGEDVNIIWADGQPMIELSQIPDNKVVNEVEVRFEEAANNDTERPLIVDDPNQKLLAGRQLGPDYSLSVPKKYAAFGVNNLAEAVRVAYRLLKYGEFDSGGTDNNLRVKLTVPFEQALGIVRYDIIKIVSDLLDGHTIGYGSLQETPEYFRVTSLKKVSGNRCEITAQAYNHTSYSAFETVYVPTPPTELITIVYAGSPEVNNVTCGYVGTQNSKPAWYSPTDFVRVFWTGAEWQITKFGQEYYDSPDNVDFPWQAVWTLGTNGVSPEPDVVEGVPNIAAIEPRSITSASYNGTTGILSVTLD